MNKMKFFAVAAGLALAAGITTAGQIVVNGEIVGSYDNFNVNGQGRLTINGTLDGSGGGGGGPSCGANAQPDGNGGCVCLDGFEYNGQEGGPVPENTDCSAVGGGDGGDGGDGGGGGGGGTAGCEGFNSPFSGDVATVGTFPIPSGGPYKTYIDTNEYLAIKFTMDATKAAKLEVAKGTHLQNPTATYAISPCPGDFSDRLTNASCKAEGSVIGSFYFNTGGVTSVCPLQPGQTYYLNIIYATGASNSTMVNSCGGSRCGADLTWKDVSNLL